MVSGQPSESWVRILSRESQWKWQKGHSILIGPDKATLLAGAQKTPYLPDSVSSANKFIVIFVYQRLHARIQVLYRACHLRLLLHELSERIREKKLIQIDLRFK